MTTSPEHSSKSPDIRESRAAQLSHLILELTPEAQASLRAILGNDEQKIDQYLFGASASGGDASDQPPAA